MPAQQPLHAAEINAALANLPDWSIEDGKLFAEFKFKNFVDAFGFMTKAALHAERLDHHPEWFNVYNKVRVHLVTHSADNSISKLDLKLAKVLSELAA